MKEVSSLTLTHLKLDYFKSLFQSGSFFVRFTDRLKGRMKLMFTTILSLALVDFTYFIIITNKWIDVIPFKPGNGMCKIKFFLLALE